MSPLRQLDDSETDTNNYGDPQIHLLCNNDVNDDLQGFTQFNSPQTATYPSVVRDEVERISAEASSHEVNMKKFL